MSKDRIVEPYDCKIYIRIPFTIYWVGRMVRGCCRSCRHQCYYKISLFTREFDSAGYYWKSLGDSK